MPNFNTHWCVALGTISAQPASLKDGSGKIEVKETVRGIGRITFPELPEGTHVEMS